MKRFISLTVIETVVASVLLILVPTSASAAPCPDPAKDGRTIGKIVVGSVSVDVKNVNYPAGGQLDPPRSPLAVGLSVRHAPLSSEVGSSILVWHINYAGCNGKLNVINNKKRGYVFSVVDENGKTRSYAVTRVVQVPKGKYRPEWFRLDGPRQLVFITCIGVVVDGHYKDNLVLIAKPIS